MKCPKCKSDQVERIEVRQPAEDETDEFCCTKCGYAAPAHKFDS